MKLLHDITVWDSKGIRTRRVVPFMTEVSPKYFRTHHPKYSSEEHTCLAWDGTKVVLFDVEGGKLRVSKDAEEYKEAEVLGMKMLLSVPIEVLSQWMTWPELGSPDVIKIIRARMEGLL